MGGAGRSGSGAGGLSRPVDSYSRASAGYAEGAGAEYEDALLEALEAENLAQDDGETFGDLRIGIGHCFMSDERACSEACMAYSRSAAETGSHPCRLLDGLNDVVLPAMEQRDARTTALQEHARSNYALADAINHLAKAIEEKK